MLWLISYVYVDMKLDTHICVAMIFLHILVSTTKHHGHDRVQNSKWSELFVYQLKNDMFVVLLISNAAIVFVLSLEVSLYFLLLWILCATNSMIHLHWYKNIYYKYHFCKTVIWD